jgi:hypothetical protein
VFKGNQITVNIVVVVRGNNSVDVVIIVSFGQVVEVRAAGQYY